MIEKSSHPERTAALNDLTHWSRSRPTRCHQRSLRFKFQPGLGLHGQGGLGSRATESPSRMVQCLQSGGYYLSTHDCGGLSSLDIRMAKAIDQITQTPVQFKLDYVTYTPLMVTYNHSSRNQPHAHGPKTYRYLRIGDRLAACQVTQDPTTDSGHAHHDSAKPVVNPEKPIQPE